MGEALRQIGEAGTGDVVEAMRYARTVLGETRRLQNLPEEELMMQLGVDGVFVGSGIIQLT